MYEPFFGFQKRPFAATPDSQSFVEFPWLYDLHNDLLHCLTQGQGIAVLTGAAGSGKTLLCQRLRVELEKEFATILLQSANFPTPRSFIQSLLFELDRPYLNMDESELRLELNSAIRSLTEDKTALVVIVDEAHQLGAELLLEIRNLINLTQDGVALVRLLLAGQLQLEENLVNPAVSSLNERIAAQGHVQTLTRQESAYYLEKKIDIAGSCMEAIFTEKAIQAICHASDGVPRCLNQLCDHALLLAYLAECKQVDWELVREALNDLKQLPLQWNDTFEPNEAELAETAPEENTVSADITEAADSESMLSIEREQYEVDEIIEPEANSASVAEFDTDLIIESQEETEQTVQEDSHEVIAVEVGAGDDADAAIDSGGDQTDGTAETKPVEHESFITEEEVWDNIEAMQEIVNLALHEEDSDQISDLTCAPESEIIFDSLEYDVVQLEEESVTDGSNQIVQFVDETTSVQADQQSSPSTNVDINLTDSRDVGEFVEIPVLDRYALLDSGNSLPDDFSEQTIALFGDGYSLPQDVELQLDLHTESPGSFDEPIIIEACDDLGRDTLSNGSPSASQSESDNFPVEDKLWEPYPSALADDVLPLLELANQNIQLQSEGTGQVQNQNQDAIVVEQKTTEPGSVTLLSQVNGGNSNSTTNAPIMTDPPVSAETDSGAAVLNVFARLQENISEFLSNVNTTEIEAATDSETRAQETSKVDQAAVSQAARYDAITPEQTSSSNPESVQNLEVDAGSESMPTQHFGNLFSRLRRRLQSGKS